MDDFSKRIGLNTELKNISLEVCKNYKLGEFVSNEVITMGYEDYTYKLTTSKGDFCVKIFNKNRSLDDIKLFMDRLKVISNSKVSSPKMLSVNDDTLFVLDYEGNIYNICVFEFVYGKNLFGFSNSSLKDIIKEIAYQTATINNLEIETEFVYDCWSIANFCCEYNKKKNYLASDDRKYFEDLIIRFKNIDFDMLPKGFVHGDIRNTNVIFDNNKKIWIIDFSVSNILPRIIDLAVIASSICLDKNSKDNTYNNIYLLLYEYNKYNKLTKYEIDNFYLFYEIGNAVNILQTEYNKKNKDDLENSYWMSMGRLGLLYSDYDKFNKILSKVYYGI